MTGGNNSPGINAGIGKLQSGGLLLGVVGLVLTGVGFVTLGRSTTLHSWLFAFVFWMALTIGCFAFTMLQHLVRGSFGRPILRIVEAGSSVSNFIVMFLVLLPILIFAADIYPWAKPGALDNVPKLLAFKAGFLRPTTVWLCTIVFYFGAWMLLSGILRKLSLDEDRTSDRSLAQWRTNISAFGMVYFFITATFAFTHWVMSIDAMWFSTIYGVWFIVGGGLCALAMSIFLLCRWRVHQVYQNEVTPTLTKDLGNLTLAITMFWMYVTLSQFLIIWSGNLPEETSYFLIRMAGPWRYMGTVLVVFGFFVPFLCLLAPRTKRYTGILQNVALLILAIRVLDMFWVVSPTLRPNGPYLQWTDIAAFIGVGGVWVWSFATQLKSAALIPNHITGPSQTQEELSHA